ncbi:Uncharacterized protein Adt_12652 [Abeliophyllum distichum]|uniref:PH domain-containing protein n=1 Tax=Abeliophyllum distichum TaxID=126358 RepID=A0ABD1UT44_9LAMI
MAQNLSDMAAVSSDLASISNLTNFRSTFQGLPSFPISSLDSSAYDLPPVWTPSEYQQPQLIDHQQQFIKQEETSMFITGGAAPTQFSNQLPLMGAYEDTSVINGLPKLSEMTNGNHYGMCSSSALQVLEPPAQGKLKSGSISLLLNFDDIFLESETKPRRKAKVAKDVKVVLVALIQRIDLSDVGYHFRRIPTGCQRLLQVSKEFLFCSVVVEFEDLRVTVNVSDDIDGYNYSVSRNFKTISRIVQVVVVEKFSPEIAQKSPTKYQNLILMDSEGSTVQAILYDQNITSFQDELTLGKAYLISNALIKLTNAKYRAKSGDMQWTKIMEGRRSEQKDLNNSIGSLDKKLNKLLQILFLVLPDYGVWKPNLVLETTAFTLTIYGTDVAHIVFWSITSDGPCLIQPWRYAQSLWCQKWKDPPLSKALSLPVTSPKAAQVVGPPFTSHNDVSFPNVQNIIVPSELNSEEEREDDTMNNIPEKYRSTIKEDNTRNWLKGKSLTSFLRSRKEKKKDETRLQTSQLHAALSLTQLAAAIAGISRGKQDFTQIHKGKSVASGQDMGEVVASAAALVTAAFAEAAESLGAQRAQVRAAVNSGMAIQNPIDMIEVTATAATCLRGAAILKSRTMANTFASTQEMLRMDAQICIIMPSGRKECTKVNVYIKQKHLILSFRKKYFGGALTSSKEYKVVSILEETGEHQEYSFLSVKTSSGVIKLLFQDKMQSRIWISTIFNLLDMHSPYWQTRHKDYHFHSSNTIV